MSGFWTHLQEAPELASGLVVMYEREKRRGDPRTLLQVMGGPEVSFPDTAASAETAETSTGRRVRGAVQERPGLGRTLGRPQQTAHIENPGCHGRDHLGCSSRQSRDEIHVVCWEEDSVKKTGKA